MMALRDWLGNIHKGRPLFFKVYIPFLDVFHVFSMLLTYPHTPKRPLWMFPYLIVVWKNRGKILLNIVSNKVANKLLFILLQLQRNTLQITTAMVLIRRECVVSIANKKSKPKFTNQRILCGAFCMCLKWYNNFCVTKKKRLK